MKKEIKYSNEQIVISGSSVQFNFLQWLQANRSFDQFHVRYAKEIVESLGYGIVNPSEDQKIISFADITFGSNLTDSDFLHLSKDYRLGVQYDYCSQSEDSRERCAKRNIWQYCLSLWDLSEIISSQLEAPNKKILKSYNNFYLRANNKGVLKVHVLFQPKTKKRFTENIFKIFSAEMLDDGDLSGRLFFGCGTVC